MNTENKIPKIFKSRRSLAINLILFAILYLSVSFNKEFIRPVFGQMKIIGVFTGSFSNFMAAFIISLFPFTPILNKNIELKKAKLIVFIIAILVFLILTIEEIHPLFGASSQFDFYDIIASAIGSMSAILTFEFIIKKWITNKL